VEFRRVTIQDTTPPVIYLDNSAVYSDFTTIVYLGELYTFPIASATDNNTNASLFVGDTGKSAVQLDTVGNYDIIYNVQDGNNSTTIVQTISVRNPFAPRITLNGNSTITIDYNSVYIDQGAVSVDSENNILSIDTVSDVCTNLIGTYNVTYTSVNGNLKSTETRTVIVKDLSPPVLLLSGDISYSLIVGSNFVDPGVIVSDNYDSSDNINISYLYELNGTEVNNLDTNIVGNYKITYTATDTCNNAVSISREVLIVDNIAPIIELNGASTINLNHQESYIEPGVNVSDNYDTLDNITLTTYYKYQSSIDVSSVDVENIDTNVLGVYTIYYNATDSNNNISTVIRTIIVSDTIAQSPTYNITVTVVSSSYNLSGNDRNGVVSGEEPTININVSDTLELDVSVSGHPLWIKPVSSTGTSNGVSDPVASNNGATSGTISWRPNNAGTYHYICQYHSTMVGTIIVS